MKLRKNLNKNNGQNFDSEHGRTNKKSLNASLQNDPYKLVVAVLSRAFDWILYNSYNFADFFCFDFSQQ